MFNRVRVNGRVTHFKTFAATPLRIIFNPCIASGVAGLPLQLQCYHCEEYSLDNDCSSPQFIVNCTANIQNACQKEVLVGSDGVSYRKVCASFTTCLIVSAGYQSFCSPGKVGSVCISCCNTPLCNGPRPPRISAAESLTPAPQRTALSLVIALLLITDLV
ncbi:ly6/PLAUR domain-containing protein 1-like [Acipenser ruthenus]|uniref:ly6/PLAUR domain-containing protein 1-like n=1 Tax=Acipenser ruthenus TaxID=7906 RepID=UPI002741BCE5|nr:ly6/PLAUR domain-containing protein 1-like [Acipenser ruthenus]